MTRAGSAGRVFAAAMSIAVAGAMLYAQNKEKQSAPPAAAIPTIAAASSAPAVGAPPTAAVPPGPVAAAPGTPSVANSAEADLLMASAPVAAQDYKVQLPRALPRSRACRSTPSGWHAPSA